MPHPNTKLSLAERFWMKVNKLGPVIRPELGPCWLWAGGGFDRNGYGRYTLKNYNNQRSERIFAHRLSWILIRGPIPGTLRVLHHCDNPPCVRPDHLFLGTLKDNVQDCMAKGRYVSMVGKGSTHIMAKLTEAQVLEIRKLAEEGWLQREIGARYGVKQSLISRIVNRRIWPHI